MASLANLMHACAERAVIVHVRFPSDFVAQYNLQRNTPSLIIHRHNSKR